MGKNKMLSNLIEKIDIDNSGKIAWEIHNSDAILYCKTWAKMIWLEWVCSKTHNDHDYVKLEKLLRETKEFAEKLSKDVNLTIAKCHSAKESIQVTKNITTNIMNYIKNDIIQNVISIAYNFE